MRDGRVLQARANRLDAIRPVIGSSPHFHPMLRAYLSQLWDGDEQLMLTQQLKEKGSGLHHMPSSNVDNFQNSSNVANSQNSTAKNIVGKLVSVSKPPFCAVLKDDPFKCTFRNCGRTLPWCFSAIYITHLWGLADCSSRSPVQSL